MGVPIPPDFTTFWQQANQQGYQPKLATIGKALLFPSVVEGIGETANNLGTEVWWHPTAPYTSSLTGQSAQELADAYEEGTGRQWTQPLGFSHALFEVAAAAVTAAGSTDGDAINDALDGLSVDTVVGPVEWGTEGRAVLHRQDAGHRWTVADDRRREVPVRARRRVQHPRPRRADGRLRRAAELMASPLLEVRGLHKRFGRVVTADDVTFSVAAGTALGIVGPNGAGKSSLLNLVNGTLVADRGTIHLDGRDVTGLGADRRGRLGIGRSYQVPRPFGGMTVFENVLVGARFAGGLRAAGCLRPRPRGPRDDRARAAGQPAGGIPAPARPQAARAGAGPGDRAPG